MNRHPKRWLIGALGIAIALLSELALASAGRLLYVRGQVEIRRAGAVITGERGMPLEVRDEVAVGAQSRAQLRMADGALIALQPKSTLVIEQYTYSVQQADDSLATSVLRLVKGGLRTITGLVGKRGTDSYKLNTTVATIGVRGTDYRIALCQGGDCGATPDGLYLGVSEGSIVVSNGAGELVLLNDEFAYVESSGSPPQRLLQPPQILETVLDKGGGPDGAGNEYGDAGGPGEDDCHCDLAESEPGYRDTVVPGKLLTADGTLLVAHTTASSAVAPVSVGTGVVPGPPASIDDQGRLRSFQGLTGSGISAFQVGEGPVVNVGFDPETQLRWGRWSETASIGGSLVDLSDRDLHWIAAEAPSLFALPITGIATYDVVGNTNPTDNAGNIGTLGSASLSANFVSQTVTNSLSLSINNQVWTASGTASLNSPSPLFAGNYSTVTVNGAASGNGSFAGFFIAPAEGQALPQGAGVSYNLNSGPTTVSGAAAFGRRR
jgi:hypothetical protein